MKLLNSYDFAAYLFVLYGRNAHMYIDCHLDRMLMCTNGAIKLVKKELTRLCSLPDTNEVIF